MARLVSTDASVVRATARRPRRSMRNRPTSSPAMCWASAADPPLPKISTPPPSLHEACPDLPGAVIRLVEKALAKRPEDRYQSMDEVIDALEACRQGGPAAPVGAEAPSDSAHHRGNMSGAWVAAHMAVKQGARVVRYVLIAVVVVVATVFLGLGK